MAYPTVATLAGLVTYSNATPIDGYALILVAYPQTYTPTQISIANQLIPQRIGDRIKVRIQQGQWDGSARIIFNSSLEPPNTKYACYFYDNDDVLLGNVSTLFTVNTSPYTINWSTATIPTAPTVLPTP